jgi:hypothetical protein
MASAHSEKLRSIGISIIAVGVVIAGLVLGRSFLIPLAIWLSTHLYAKYPALMSNNVHSTIHLFFEGLRWGPKCYWLARRQ